MTNKQLPLVSVLFITYKRYEMLEKSLRKFLQNTDYPNLEIVIADDGSGLEIQRQIRNLPANVFALMPKNKGLGANNNNGLRHCGGKYILMIQDDCMCAGPSDYLMNTIGMMEANPRIGIVNYYGAPHPVDDSRILPGSDEPCYIMPKAFENGTKEFFLYTDQPHVMSRAAFERIGFYVENTDIVQCEEDYNRRWRDQTDFATAMFPAYYNKVYVHEGAELSFRTSRFRYRLDSALMPLATFCKRHCKPLYTGGKMVIRTAVTTMEKFRLVR